MNGNDELRQRIARLDPMAPSVQTDSVHFARTRALLETIMAEDTTTLTPTVDPGGARSGRRRGPVLLAAAAVTIVIAAGVAMFVGGDSDDPVDDLAGPPTSDSPTSEQSDEAEVPLALSTGESDPLLQSCIAISPELVADVPVAFRGTVSAKEVDRVTIDIDTWYVGGDAATATITAPPGLEALIGGIDFVVGDQYLITAFDGVVNYCGFSGPADPDLQAIFDQAFPQ